MKVRQVTLIYYSGNKRYQPRHAGLDPASSSFMDSAEASLRARAFAGMTILGIFNCHINIFHPPEPLTKYWNVFLMVSMLKISSILI